MTGKRFTQKDEDDWEILDQNKHFAYAHSGHQAEKIIQELNELVETNRELYKDNKQLKQGLNDDLELIGQLQEENEKLKQSYKEFEDECQSTFNAMNRTQNHLYRKNFKLKEENEQLKQFKEKVFTWINREIAKNKKAIEWGKETGVDSSSMGFYNHMLKRLKKELEE